MPYNHIHNIGCIKEENLTQKKKTIVNRISHDLWTDGQPNPKVHWHSQECTVYNISSIHQEKSAGLLEIGRYISSLEKHFWVKPKPFCGASQIHASYIAGTNPEGLEYDSILLHVAVSQDHESQPMVVSVLQKSSLDCAALWLHIIFICMCWMCTNLSCF